MIEISFDSTELAAILGVLDAIASGKSIEQALKSVAPQLEATQRTQYELVKKLPYAPGYLGQKKPSGRAVAGGAGDKGYAVDTEALYSDVTKFHVGDDGLSLEAFSDLPYAGFQEGLAESKGVGFFYDDEVYLKLLEQAIEQRLEAVL